jgi:hypothetical protein
MRRKPVEKPPRDSETMEHGAGLAVRLRNPLLKQSPLLHNPTVTGPPACRIHSWQPTSPDNGSSPRLAPLAPAGLLHLIEPIGRTSTKL